MKKVTISMGITMALVVVMLLADSVEGVNNTSPDSNDVTTGEILFALVFFTILVSVIVVVILNQKSSVIMLQVAVSDILELERDLFIISKVADSKRDKGFKFMLSELVSRLLRHPDCCYRANSSVDVISMVTGNWKKCFDHIFHEENKQFDGSDIPLKGAKRSNYFVVVTILVAAPGGHRLPEINSHIDLEKAFAYLTSIPQIHDVKVFWTPEDGQKKLLKKDMDQHFPLLRPL